MTEQKHSTMFERAIHDAAEPQGRFAQHAQHSHPVITGTSPSAPGLVAPNWSVEAAALPDEPPLNVDVNELPDMETLSGLPREEAP